MAWHLTLLSWLIHTALGGSLILLAGTLVVYCCRQPVRRVYVIELALIGALLIPWVGLVPELPRLSVGWLNLEPAQMVSPALPDTTTHLDCSPPDDAPLISPAVKEGQKSVAVVPPAHPLSLNLDQRRHDYHPAATDLPMPGTPLWPSVSTPASSIFSSFVAWLILAVYGSVTAVLLLATGRAGFPDTVAPPRQRGSPDDRPQGTLRHLRLSHPPPSLVVSGGTRAVEQADQGEDSRNISLHWPATGMSSPC